MKRTVIAVIVFSVWLGTARPAPAQPILERLEQRIRDRLNQRINPDKPDQPAVNPAAERPERDADKEPGYLGVVADDKEDRGRGVRVLEVRPGGPAEKAGIRKRDLITGLAGIRVRQMSDMADVLELFPAGDSLTFDILRDGQLKKIKVTLGRRPAPAGQPPADVAPVEPPAAGPKPADPHTVKRPLDAPARIEQLQRRIEQLERRVAELERALAEPLKKE